MYLLFVTSFCMNTNSVVTFGIKTWSVIKSKRNTCFACCESKVVFPVMSNACRLLFCFVFYGLVDCSMCSVYIHPMAWSYVAMQHTNNAYCCLLWDLYGIAVLRCVAFCDILPIMKNTKSLWLSDSKHPLKYTMVNSTGYNISNTANSTKYMKCIYR